MRFQNLILAYFLVGAMMWGGGAIQWDDTGVATLIVSVDNGDVDAQEDTKDDAEKMGGPIQEGLQSVGGGALLAVWNFVVKFLGFLFWPVLATQTIGSPTRVVVLVGGGLTTAFLGAIIRLVRTSG